MKVNNKIIAFFWNKLDVPIRFLYCRTPLLHKFFYNKLYKSNLKDIEIQLEKMNKILKKHHFSLKEKTCLEIGPGNSHLSAFYFLMKGAKKVILIDKFPRKFNEIFQNNILRKEVKLIRKKFPNKKLFFIKEKEDKIILFKKYIYFISGDITEIKLKQKVDFIFSISVLEHVKNLEKVILKFSKILKNGGLMYHWIDLRDHYNTNAPYIFYKYSKGLWEKYLTKEGISYTNRLRQKDYVELFEKYQFTIIENNQKSIKFPKKLKIDKLFLNYPIKNLQIATTSFLLKKKI